MNEQASTFIILVVVGTLHTLDMEAKKYQTQNQEFIDYKDLNTIFENIKKASKTNFNIPSVIVVEPGTDINAGAALAINEADKDDTRVYALIFINHGLLQNVKTVD